MKWRATLAYALAAAALGVVVLLPLGLGTALFQLELPGIGLDFRNIYFDQVQRLKLDPPELAPYWFYPPAAALLFSALGPLDPAHALAVWLGACGLLAFALAWLCRAELRALGGPAAWAGGLGLVLSSAPVLHCLKWGQVSLLIAVLSFVGLTRGPRVGPYLLGLAAAIKLYPVLYLAGAPRGDRRRFVTAAILALLVFGLVVPLIALGPRTTVLIGARVVSVVLEGVGQSQTLGSVLERWFVRGVDFGDGRGPQPWLFALPPVLVSALSAGAGALLCALSLVRLPHGPEHAGARVALLMTGLCCVVAPAWHHYYVCVPLAQAAALMRVRSPAAVALLALSLVLSIGIVYALPFSPRAWPLYDSLGGTLVSAIAAWGALRLSLRGEAAAPTTRTPTRAQGLA